MERSPRLAAAVFVLAGGLVHLQLWLDGYRGIPYVGPSFLANALASALLALAVSARPGRAVAAAGILLSAVTLAALVMSRTVGVLGFTEPTWTDQAVRATAAEVGAIVALAAALVASGRAGRGSPRRTRPPAPAGAPA